MTAAILVGKGGVPVTILPHMANRLGLVAGATGTGKTVTLQRLAESFSRIGVPVLLDKVEQVVRLIRSKGVGVYFVTQRPSDVPDDVLGQLGNRVQHALHAFTPIQCRPVHRQPDRPVRGAGHSRLADWRAPKVKPSRSAWCLGFFASNARSLDHSRPPDQ
jgi:hypothetical protein